MRQTVLHTFCRWKNNRALSTIDVDNEFDWFEVPGYNNARKRHRKSIFFRTVLRSILIENSFHSTLERLSLASQPSLVTADLRRNCWRQITAKGLTRRANLPPPLRSISFRHLVSISIRVLSLCLASSSGHSTTYKGCVFPQAAPGRRDRCSCKATR